jgi:L-Ala-D/L-Glu epimerase
LFTTRICLAAETQELRRSVLRPQWSPDQALPGDDVVGVVHIGTFDADNLAVSACLLYAEACDFGTDPSLDNTSAWRLRSMATDPARRGTGAGVAVLQLAYRIGAAAGAELIWCHARQTAIGFYQRDGWRPVGEQFEEIGLAHVNMWRPLIS